MRIVAIDAAHVPLHLFLNFNDVPDRIERRHDKDDLRNRLLDQLEAVLMYLFPNGKSVRARAADAPGGGVQWIRAEQAASAQLGARCS